MRMIDADKMPERLEVWNTSDNTDKALYNFAWNRIAEQPTAYDIDKVAKEVNHLIAVEFSWLRIAIFEKEYIDLSKIDAAERALKTKVMELIKAGEQE